MSESMNGLKRTKRCALFGSSDEGQKVTLMGWVQKKRNLGSLIFIDLRDVSGIIQVVFDENSTEKEVFEKANGLHSEYVIAVEGTIKKREGEVNKVLKTGEIEVEGKSLRILSESKTPPFPIERDIDTREELRLKYRYLDLRRPDIRDNIILKSRVMQLVRNFLTNEGFLEIETPMLTKSTPEGARDYLVPSRVHPGSFYALPQSPQLFKQLLMCSGYDRYMQIVRCFRDEDLRADRQPEFTQIDMELSFVDEEDVMDINERLLKYVWKEALGVDIKIPFKRIPYNEAMERYGSDKPDTRFGMELRDVSDTVPSAIDDGGSVRGINVKGQGGMGRKKIDKLTEYVRGIGAKGLAYIQLTAEGEIKSSFKKFLKDDEMADLIKAMDGENGDLLLFISDKNKMVFDILGSLRVKLGEDLGLIDEDEFDFLWVTDFPVFEWSEEEERYKAMHHPFTSPKDEDIDRLESDKGSVKAKAYDVVLNGVELGGGSVRIHRADVQESMLEALGFTMESAHEQFGFLLDAFSYGVPPHAGLAYGLDRMIMLMGKAKSIRDTIAFPKVKDASDLMSNAPSEVDEKQLKELWLTINNDGKAD